MSVLDSIQPHFLLQAEDRAYVVYDDSSTIFHEGSSPQATRPQYIGLLQGSKTSGNWDLLWLFIGSTRPYGIVTRLRGGKWSPYASWFQIPLKACNLDGQWSRLAMISNAQSMAVYQVQLTNEEALTHPSSILELQPLHHSNSSFMLSFSTNESPDCVDNILMSSLVAAHGGSPA